MLATQVRQKDSVFYFVSYPAEDLLAKVRFMSRFYSNGESIPLETAPEEDEVGQFIGRIERSDRAFQRQVSKAKVAAIENFYETAMSQPPIPGTVLLFTSENLGFEPVGKFDNVGDMREPQDRYLVIDGQHRLAALYFFLQHRPEDARTIYVPCMIFDGKSEDFAAEMFVIINSTPTRINKSHLVDLYERVSWAAPDKKFAARVVDLLYHSADSPLCYKINRLGGRSRQEKWILQAELFNELHRWIADDWETLEKKGTGARQAERFYGIIRDFLKACASVWEEAWGNPGFMVTRPVTLKAMLRVCADLSREESNDESSRVDRFVKRLGPWSDLKREFRADGFYERFPAKGQVERVARVHRELARAARVALPGEKKRKK